MENYDSSVATQSHIYRVQELLSDVRSNILVRSEIHDQSKLGAPEKVAFDTYTPLLSGMVYGSPEYMESIKLLGPALKHHYEQNSHHPEHYDNGMEGMSLIDIIEMLVDWKASSERMKDGGDIYLSIEKNQSRFGYPDMVKSIFINTARELGW